MKRLTQAAVTREAERLRNGWKKQHDRRKDKRPGPSVLSPCWNQESAWLAWDIHTHTTTHTTWLIPEKNAMSWPVAMRFAPLTSVWTQLICFDRCVKFSISGKGCWMDWRHPAGVLPGAQEDPELSDTSPAKSLELHVVPSAPDVTEEECVWGWMWVDC